MMKILLRRTLNSTSELSKYMCRKLMNYITDKFLPEVIEECKKDKKFKKFIVQNKLPRESLVGALLMAFVLTSVDYIKMCIEHERLDKADVNLFIHALTSIVYDMLMATFSSIEEQERGDSLSYQ